MNVKRFTLPMVLLTVVMLLVLGAAVASAQTNVPGASNSPSGADPILHEQVIPDASASAPAASRGLTAVSAAPSGPVCETIWGQGWNNEESVLGVGTQVLRGAYYTPSDSADLGTCDEVPGALWITSRYAVDVEIEYSVSATRTFTVTFASATWTDLDKNGVLDLLPLGETWGGVPATITMTLAGYTETWGVEIGVEPALVDVVGVSPVPVPKPAARAVAAGPKAFEVGIGWDAVPNGFNGTVLYGAFYDGAEMFVVCNGNCAVVFNGKDYRSTNSDGWKGDPYWDASLPGTPSGGTTVGPWAFTVKQAGKADETWTFPIGGVPTKK